MADFHEVQLEDGTKLKVAPGTSQEDIQNIVEEHYKQKGDKLQQGPFSVSGEEAAKRAGSAGTGVLKDVAAAGSIGKEVPALFGLPGVGPSGPEAYSWLKQKLPEPLKKAGVGREAETPGQEAAENFGANLPFAGLGGTEGAFLGIKGAANAAKPASWMGKVLADSLAPALTSTYGGQLADKAAPDYAEGVRMGSAAMTPMLARRILTPRTASAERTADTSILRKAGVKGLSAGEKTGNENLAATEQKFGLKNPAQGQFQRWATSLTGVPSDKIDKAYFAKAKPAVSNEFERLANNTQMPNSVGLQGQLTNFQHKYSSAINSDATKAANAELGRINAVMQKGHMTGQEYQALRSQLGSAAYSADGATARMYYELRNTLDDAMDQHLRSSNHPDAGKWSQARDRFRALETIERAALKNTDSFARGEVSPSQLSKAARDIYGDAFTTGKDPFSKVTDAASKVWATGEHGKPIHEGVAELAGAGLGTALAGVASHNFGLPFEPAMLPGLWLGGLTGKVLGKALGDPVRQGVTTSGPAQFLRGNQIFAGKDPALAMTLRALKQRQDEELKGERK